MAKTPVTKLMSQNGNDLLRITLLDQSIVNNNVFLPRKTIEVCIAVSAALATIDNVQLVEREAQLLSQSLNTSLQFTRFKRRELIEQRQNHKRVDSNSEDLNEDHEKPHIVEKGVPSLLNDLHHSANEGSA